MITILQSQNVTMNFHHMGVTPQSYVSIPALSSFFKIISTNVDRGIFTVNFFSDTKIHQVGREFISTVEAIHYPIYATQWHPGTFQIFSLIFLC